MSQRHLRIVVIALIAAATAACGGGAPSPTSSPTPSALPSQTRLAPSPSEQATATLTLIAGVEADGPGTSVSEAIASAGKEPRLVNGSLLKEVDGTAWLCEAFPVSSPPRCTEPRLRVENSQPEGSPVEDHTFDAGAGVHEANGVRWVEHVQLYGVIRP